MRDRVTAKGARSNVNQRPLQPTDMMDELYKLRIQITEIVSGEDLWCIGCQECWKKKENNVHKILLNAIDVDHNGVDEPKFTEFSFFGKQGGTIVGKDPCFPLAYTSGQVDRLPSEISALVGKKFSVTVTPNS